MRILSMTATFGQLEHATLTLESGLNIIEAPNEWGKSTWCAFMAAMLYGIDSRAHSATKAGLADKTRYEPWSGQPMSGRMELIWQGRAITIERGSTSKAAFRQFKAYETDSGLPVPELTGENCGEVLLGVEKEVFLRTAFIRLADLPVTQNEALRRRLNALVTTGDESGAADLLESRLNKLRNEIRANRSHGLLPQAEAEKQALSEQLIQLEALQNEASRLAAEQQALEQQERLLIEEQAHSQQQEEAAKTENFLRLQEARRLRAEKAIKLAALEAPQSQKAFAGLTAEDASADQQAYWAACGKRHRPWRLALCSLPVLLSLGALAIPHWCGLVLCFLLLGAGIGLLWAELHRQRRAGKTAVALEKKYGGIPAALWPEHIRDILSRNAEYNRTYRELTESLALIDGQIADLESILRHFPTGRQNEALLRCRELLQQNQLAQGRCLGRMDSLGSETDLRAQLDRIDQRIRELTDKLSAIELALSTLQEAKAQLQRRFAPQITHRAQTLFARMTGGRYDRLLLSEDLSLQAATAAEDILRSSLWRSEGTVDQLYLSLRLAVSAELVPDAPLVLDDALVRFDDQRLKKAMEVLREESQNRQVLLFTCQSREKNCI